MEYELIRSRRKSLTVESKSGRLIVRAPWFATDAQIERFLWDNRERIEAYLEKAQAREKEKEGIRKLTHDELMELANRAKAVIPQRLAYYAPLVGVTYGRITIRNQRTRWGSCSGKGNLNLNCLLMLAPPEVLDSVIVHELCHRKEPNHSERF